MPLQEAISVILTFSPFNKDDTNIKMALYSLIKFGRKKEHAKELILQEYLGFEGLSQIY